MIGPVVISLMLIQGIQNLPALSCAIDLARHDEVILITGRIKGEPGQSGWYQMDTLGRTGSSKSVSRQSGKFYIEANGEVTLGQSMIGASVGTIVIVEIIGESDQTHESFDCRANT